ncbi:MAG TPA: 50S ribosomal protein L9 [Candidatus Paceibacterota bacterium]|jgi:large subunit ribosomal protein L9|nr:50S ribosomal protein L9 [Candidatus Paceibacterota bacterium]
MKVILLKDIRNVGKKYEIKEVAEGFAMNSLIPRNLATAATAGAMKRLDGMKAQDMAARSARDAETAKNLEKIEGVEITMSGKANEGGHLFAAIHKDDIIDELRKQSGLDIEADHIVLDKPVKEAGKHKIPVAVGGKTAEFTLVVETA